MTTTLLVRNLKAKHQPIQRCSHCTRATLPEFLLNGDRLLCKSCKERFLQRQEVTELTQQQFHVMQQFRLGEAVEAIAKTLNLTYKAVIDQLEFLHRRGLISVPQSVLESSAPSTEAESSTPLKKSRSRTPRPKLRHIIRPIKPAEIRKDPNILRKNKRGQAIALCELDAKILDLSKTMMEEFAFCSEIASQLELSIGCVHRRLQKLHRLGFEVPNRKARRAKLIISVFEKSAQNLSKRQIARDLNLDESSIRRSLKVEGVYLPAREPLIQQVYRYLQNRPAPMREVIQHFEKLGRTSNSVRWVICNLKIQGLIYNDYRGGPLMTSTNAPPSTVHIFYQKKSS